MKGAKNYIGREEAWELSLERGFDKLPRKGQEYIQSIAKWEYQAGKRGLALGNDETGFYLQEQNF